MKFTQQGIPVKMYIVYKIYVVNSDKIAPTSNSVDI